MPIPDQVSAGDLGHVEDHNDIVSVITDHESRVSNLELESNNYIDTSSAAQEKSGNLNLTGNVTINNLTVTGTQTINNTESFSIQDPIIYMAVGQWEEDSVDGGIIVAYGQTGGDAQNHYHTGLLRDSSDSGKWKLVSGLPHETGNEINFTGATYDTLKLGTIEVSSTNKVNNLNSDKLDDQEGSYYLNWGNFTNIPSPTITLSGDASGSITLTSLSGGTLQVTVADNSHGHTIANIDNLQTTLNSKASESDLSNHTSATTSVHGISNTADLATKSYVDTAESDAISSANSYSDSLSSNYEVAGAAAAALSDAQDYTDSQISSVISKVEHVARATWTGTAIQSSVEAASVGVITVTFPVNKFSQTPKVFTQNIDDGSSARMSYAKFSPYSISSESVSMEVINHAPPSTVTGGGSITKAIVDVLAIQEAI